MTSRFTQLLQLLLDRAEAHETELRKLTPALHASLAAAATYGRARGIAGIARALGLSDPESMKDLIARLEDMGYVHRVTRDYESCSLDPRKIGRIHSVLLTREGAEALVDHQNLEQTVIERTLDGLDEDAGEAFLTFLAALGEEHLSEDVGPVRGRRRGR